MSLIELPELVQGADAARFWNLVNKGANGSCWHWLSSQTNSGYGKFWLCGKSALAHRVAYRIAYGPIPLGAHVRHTCDNKLCVNPGHLLTGSRKDNAQDAVERGLYLRGEANPRAKLTVAQVIEIKAPWAPGETQISMARRFGVSPATIQWILIGRTWVGVGDPA